MPEAHKIAYRLMSESDLAAAMYIRKAALESIEPGQARPSSWVPSFPRIPQHLLRTDPAGSVVAEIDGLIVGYAQALLRGDIWFLAQLFVQPEAHALGIGDGLLSRAEAYGRANGARIFSVVSTAQPVSQSLYMRHGMFAFGIGYRMNGDLDALRQLPEPDAVTKRITDCTDWQDRIAEMDRALFGAERRQDHAWYLAGGASSGAEASFGLTRDGNLAAYGYAVEHGGFIAPLAAYEPADQLPILRMCAEWLLDRDVASGSIWVISHNATIMRALLAAGWRINGWSFLLASEPFGKFDRYHPAGGMLL
jgi:GNAT superfamily N-acetyltransferase